MPSFDIVSKIDQHELTNAVDQANREVGTRFDFKDTGATFTLENDMIKLKAQAVFQLNQMQDVLRSKLTKRDIDARALDIQAPEENLNEARQQIQVRQGIKTELAKKIVKMIKDKKLKVQAAIQGEQVRVTGKKRDDLQMVIALLKESHLDVPVQFENFRD